MCQAPTRTHIQVHSEEVSDTENHGPGTGKHGKLRLGEDRIWTIVRTRWLRRRVLARTRVPKTALMSAIVDRRRSVRRERTNGREEERREEQGGQMKSFAFVELLDGSTGRDGHADESFPISWLLYDQLTGTAVFSLTEDLQNRPVIMSVGQDEAHDMILPSRGTWSLPR